MKIAVTATGPSLDAAVEARFGRASYYVIIDTDTMDYEAIENPNVAAGGGAGIQSAQLIAEHNAKYILTGNCGPNAFNVFGAAGVEIITGVTGNVRQAVEQFESGNLAPVKQPNVASHFGMGRGMAGGRAMGGGRGMGTGRGLAQPVAPGYYATKGEMTKEEELAALKEQEERLRKELKQIQERIAAVDMGE